VVLELPQQDLIMFLFDFIQRQRHGPEEHGGNI